MVDATTHQALHELLAGIATALHATRPIAALDLETTGVNVDVDRIVEITIARYDVERADTQSLHAVVNPGVPIPREASEVHGFTDERVASEPPFASIASHVWNLIVDADLIGYGHRRFDVRMLAAEFRRLGNSDPCDGARCVDPQLIFFKREPRDLSAALKFFCGQEHREAHGTTGDVIASLQVLTAQLGRYSDLPRTLDALDALGRDQSFIDKDGKFVWRNGQACVGFGKHQGVPMHRVDRNFFRWMLEKDFSAEAKSIARDAMRGRFPLPAGS